MKKKTGAQEHTIIIGTILASVLVFVLGFFLGRAWVMMPQEKMVQVKKESSPVVVVKSDSEGEDFEDTLAKLKQKKIMEEEMKTKEAESGIKRNQEEKRQKEEEMKLAILLEEKKKQEEQEKRKMALAKKERFLAQQTEKELVEKKKVEEKKRVEEKKKVETKKVGQVSSLSSIQKEVLPRAEKKAKEEKLTRDNISPQTPTLPSGEGEYTIQLQSSPDRQKVEELLAELRNRGHAAYAIQADLKEKGVWYRIRLGKYSSQEEAIKDAEKLKNTGVFSSYWITRR
ncbi:MAG: SPOR domain-containing protein [Nitrospirota bacterium]